MGNTSIACCWYKDISLNKHSNTTVTAIKAFTITKDKNGKQKSTIAGIWATNLEVNKENIVKIAKAARARWRIKNQCFNTLKNFEDEILGMFKLLIFESWEHKLNLTNILQFIVLMANLSTIYTLTQNLQINIIMCFLRFIGKMHHVNRLLN